VFLLINLIVNDEKTFYTKFSARGINTRNKYNFLQASRQTFLFSGKCILLCHQNVLQVTNLKNEKDLI
jgi:hypothetical protein